MTYGDWIHALSDPKIAARFRKLITHTKTHWWWTGAIMRSGHGRFWIGRVNGQNFVVAAHRFAYALEYGAAAVSSCVVVMHICDEPLCMNPKHLRPGTQQENRDDWKRRRHNIGSPLRDTRGRHARATAIRATAKTGGDVQTIIDAGTPTRDIDSPPLPGLETLPEPALSSSLTTLTNG